MLAPLFFATNAAKIENACVVIMFGLTRDVFGLILTDLGTARSFAYTCAAALAAVRSIFTITQFNCGDIRISSPSGMWQVLYDGKYISELNFRSWLDDELFDCTRKRFIRLLIENYHALGLATCNGVHVIYELNQVQPLSYFGRFIKFHGPIKCVWVGDASSPQTVKLGILNVSV